MGDLFERYKVPVLAALGVGLIGVMVWLGLRYEPPAPVEIIPPAPTATPAPLRVYVSGAVREPAVYTLPPGAIVQQAITMAGGPADDAALDALNLARPLVDGEQVVVPRQGEAAPTPLSPGPTGDASPGIGLVNINTATLDELDTLPGVGPAIAQRIIDYRTANGPFQRIEDIQNVAGIGPATFEDLRDLIIVD